MDFIIVGWFYSLSQLSLINNTTLSLLSSFYVQVHSLEQNFSLHFSNLIYVFSQRTQKQEGILQMGGIGKCFLETAALFKNKMPLLPKTIYRCNAISINIPRAVLKKLNKKIIRFLWDHKIPQTAKVILREKKHYWYSRQPLEF